MSRPGFSFLFCPDPELIRLQVENLVDAHGAGSGWDRRVYWGDEEIPGSFWQDMTIPDLMGTKRLVVVRRAHKLLKDSWDKLTDSLGSFKPDIWPIFCLEGEPDKKGNPKVPAVLKKTKYWPIAQKKNWVWSSPGLTPHTMPDFVGDFARRKNLSMTAPIARQLADVLPMDAVGAANELDKIALAASLTEGTVQPEHVALVSHQADMDVFTFISSLLEGRSPEKIWKKVFDNRNVGSTDNILFSFLALLAREVRIMWELAHDEKPSQWVMASLKGKKTALAKKLGAARLSKMLELILEAEFGIKTGQRAPEQAFEALVGGLYAIMK